MKKTERFFAIDFLRGFSILVMIFIHTSAYFLSNKVAFFFWDASEFAVVVFIFCSCYVVFKKYLTAHLPIFFYIKKRLVRLLKPYYIFLLFFLFFVYLGEPYKLTLPYLVENLFVVGGIDINWLILLFLIFSFLVPTVLILFKRRKKLFYIYFFLALFFSLFFIKNKLPLDYRITMFLPWSLIIFFSLFFVKYEEKKWFINLGLVVSFVIFFLLHLLVNDLHLSLVMYANKYPPNLYHLSYGVFSVFALYLVSKLHFLSIPIIKKFFYFMSSQSYTIYFIHFAIIYILTVFIHYKFSWLGFFVVVFLLTITVQILLLKIKHYLFSALKSGPTI